MRAALAGLGFFAQHHAEAWSRLGPGHSLAGGADPSPEARERFRRRWPGIEVTASLEALLTSLRPDVVEVVTRPDTHVELVETGLRAGAHVICQKPLAPTLAETDRLLAAAEAAGRRLLVHDNWRFQPWWLAIADAVTAGAIGRPFFARLSIRAGDGRGEAPFPDQPYFREMPRFLFYETAIHQFDVLRALFGEATEVTALTGKVRPDVAGEDLGAAVLRTREGVLAVVEGNRWSEAPAGNRAFGEAVVEGTGGRITLGPDGRARLKPIGEAERDLYVPGPEDDRGYRGDSVLRTTRHLVEALESGSPSPLEASAYRQTMRAVFAAYGEPDAG